MYKDLVLVVRCFIEEETEKGSNNLQIYNNTLKAINESILPQEIKEIMIEYLRKEVIR